MCRQWATSLRPASINGCSNNMSAICHICIICIIYIICLFIGQNKGCHKSAIGSVQSLNWNINYWIISSFGSCERSLHLRRSLQSLESNRFDGLFGRRALPEYANATSNSGLYYTLAYDRLRRWSMALNESPMKSVPALSYSVLFCYAPLTDYVDRPYQCLSLTLSRRALCSQYNVYRFEPIYCVWLMMVTVIGAIRVIATLILAYLSILTSLAAI